MSLRSLVYPTAVALLLIGAPTAVEAQDSRAELVEAARNEFDVGARTALLARAADPGLAPLDTLWALAVYDLAAVLVDQNRDELAGLWLRWAARHGTWPIDRNWYAPAVVQAYDDAVPAGLAAQEADARQSSTSWRWPDGLDLEAAGVLETTVTDPSAQVTVDVVGEGSIAPGGALSLEPGTYELVASAPGFETLRATREVLPGATTVMSFDLVPLLPDDVRSGVASSLVRIRFMRGGEQVCTNGLVARSEGLVLTSLGPIQGATSLEVVRGGDAYGDVSVAARDPNRNLAVLRFGALGLPVLPTTTEAGSDQYVWSVHHPGCAPATSARARLADWNPSAGSAPLVESLPPDALGAPVVDRAGTLLGVVVGSDRVAPVGLAQDLLDRALAAVAEETDDQVAGAGGGFPVAWVAGGAAAVGVAALLLGGGGGGDDEGPPPPTTGGIIVTFPGGAP